jgi:hypothetical protein
MRVGRLHQVQEQPRKRWRYTLRTLLVLVTLFCLYLGCWNPTKTNGVRDVSDRYAVHCVAKAPLLLVSSRTYEYTPPGPKAKAIRRRDRDYYFWFFGYSCWLFTSRSEL